MQWYNVHFLTTTTCVTYITRLHLVMNHFAISTGCPWIYSDLELPPLPFKAHRSRDNYPLFVSKEYDNNSQNNIVKSQLRFIHAFRSRVIVWNTVGFLLIGHLKANVRETEIKTQQFSLNKCRLQDGGLSIEKRRPQKPGIGHCRVAIAWVR